MINIESPKSPPHAAAWMRGSLAAMLAIALTGCAMDRAETAAVTGGVVGTGAGAGIGALIGSAMSNGSVGDSALLGGAIGLPVGIIMGVAIHESGKATQRDQLRTAVARNDSLIHSNQRALDQLREEIALETFSIRLGEPRVPPVFVGQTIGNPFR